MRQCASAKSGSCAWTSSPLKNFHCSLKGMSRPASSGTAERVTMGVLSLIVGVPAPAATISKAPTAVASQGRANERLITSVASNDLLAVDVSFQPSTAARVQRLSATFDFKRTVLDMGIALVDNTQDARGFLDETVVNSWLVRRQLYYSGTKSTVPEVSIDGPGSAPETLVCRRPGRAKMPAPSHLKWPDEYSAHPVLAIKRTGLRIAAWVKARELMRQPRSTLTVTIANSAPTCRLE